MKIKVGGTKRRKGPSNKGWGEKMKFLPYLN